MRLGGLLNKPHISAQQLVDVHYIQEFIQKSSSLKVEFRGKKELRDRALEPKRLSQKYAHTSHPPTRQRPHHSGNLEDK